MMFNYTINILLIEDEDYDVRRVRKTLEPFSEKIIIRNVVSQGDSALELLSKKRNYFDVVIMDYQIVGSITGERLIKKIKEIDNTIQIIVITKMTVNITDFDFANRLLEAGAMWYCTKYPGDIDDYIYQPTDFVLSILNAYEKKLLEQDKQRSNNKLSIKIEEVLASKIIIGESKPICELKNQIEKVAAQDATVLIAGDSGTGKELVATHIHYRSKRKFENFVTINSGSLPQELIESELFGFEKGSFTGASTSKKGLFESADKGCIFLDEISELRPSAQVKLLRVLQEGEIDKIGRTDTINVNVRTIAATNKNLFTLVEEKKFREDLFYRLNVMTLKVPSLRERAEDIPLLIKHFMSMFSEEMDLPEPPFSEGALEHLCRFTWPGNVRQLQNVLQRLLFMSEKKIDIIDVKKALSPGQIPQESTASDKQFFNSQENWNIEKMLPWRKMERSFKTAYFKFVRDNTPSDANAARKLGLAPPNYHRMCKELGLK